MMQVSKIYWHLDHILESGQNIDEITKFIEDKAIPRDLSTFVATSDNAKIFYENNLKKYGIINNNPKLNTNDFFYTTGMDITKLKSLDICLLKRIGPFVINSYISPNKEYEERDCFPLLP